MTNGEKIKEIFSDCFIVRRLSDNKIVHLVCTEEFLNSEYKEPTPKNDLEVDCIDRTELLKVIDTWDKFGCDADTKLVPYQDHYIPYIHYDDVIKCIKSMPSVTPQEPRCKECKWWKDSDGKYRRGCGAESQCPINTHAVYCGEGYCYMFSPKADMREVEE